MSVVEAKRAGAIAYREAAPQGGAELATVLCVHGFPETSYMWRDLLPALAESGRRAIAPDLPGFGDSAADPPGTWERHVEALERLVQRLGLERVALVVHDWGGLIALRWACEHPEAVAALTLSGTGFFADGKWHGMARALRAPGGGEKLVEEMTREGFVQMLGAVSRIDPATATEYWKTFESEDGKRGILELYRSGDFEKLAAYDGDLSRIGVPTLILWGEGDLFAPVAGAHRFEREIPDAELVVVEEAGHFVYADAPSRCADEIVGFLSRHEV